MELRDYRCQDCPHLAALLHLPWVTCDGSGMIRTYP